MHATHKGQSLISNKQMLSIIINPEKELLAATFQDSANFIVLVQTHQLGAEQSSPSDCAALRQQSTRIKPRAVERFGHRAHPDQK